MRKLFALLFKILFKLSFFKNHFFGIRKRIFAPLNLFKNLVFQTTINNSIKLELHIDDWIQEQLFFIGEYEKAELQFMKSVLKNDSVFIDIGANIGLHSLYVSMLTSTKGHIISFEPFDINHLRFKKNCELNSTSNIAIEKIAISNIDSFIDLHYDINSSNLGMASSFINSYTESEKVKCISLDSYLKNTPLSKVDFIKIDIEGGEYNAIVGMKNSLMKFRPILMIEILDLDSLNNEKIINFLEILGYTKYYIDDHGSLSNSEKNIARFNYVFIFENLESTL